MKTPLIYQISEYECGTVALLNAFNYLFSREEIPAKIIKTIYTHSLDLGIGGTSKKAMQILSEELNNYAESHNFKMVINYYRAQDVTLAKILEEMNHQAVIVLRTKFNEEHYVLITNVDEDNVYVFDSYYLDKSHFNNDGIKLIMDKPYSYNRKIKISHFDQELKKDYTLGKLSNREIIIIRKLS